MTAVTRETPTTFEDNVPMWKWAHGKAPDTSKPPDRFAPIPGYNNWRGGAIYSYDQLKLLRDRYGIKTIVNLSLDAMRHQPGHGPDSISCHYTAKDFALAPNPGRWQENCEPQWSKDLGLNYVYVPMTNDWRMTPEKWSLIREALVEGNAYVHCAAGVDRTGGVVARWIRETLGWDQAQAMAYTRKFGGYWRQHRDWRQTQNVKMGEWVEEAQFDPDLGARAFRPRLGLGDGLEGWLPAIALGGAGLVVWSLVWRQRRVG